MGETQTVYVCRAEWNRQDTGQLRNGNIWERANTVIVRNGIGERAECSSDGWDCQDTGWFEMLSVFNRPSDGKKNIPS